MAGTWSVTDIPTRPGFYMQFKAAALAAISTGPRGILAMPVKANWGPAQEIKEITSLNDLETIYNNDTDSPFTAYKCIRLALKGGINKVLAYRMVDGNESVASITLQDGSATSVLTLETKYPTERSFNVTVRDNPEDSANYKDIVLYEGTTKLYTYTFSKTSIVDSAVSEINNDENNLWLDATKVADGDGTLADVSNSDLTGGNAGATSITATQYTNAQSAFETRVFNAITLDGQTDSAIQDNLQTYVERLRSEGKKVIAYVGGSTADDASISNANTRSTGFNSEAVVNVGTGGVEGDTTYSSAETACYVAGLSHGQRLKDSLTYKSTFFDDVNPRLTHSEIVTAINSGTLVLVHDGTRVKVEYGINTLTSLGSDQNDAWKKIKVIRIMDAIDTDTTSTAEQNYVGKVLNNDDGQTALLTAIKNYFETLTPDLLNEDFVVEVDEDKQANAASDEFFWRYEATIVDSMEKIMGTGYISA